MLDSKNTPACLTWDAVENGVPWGLVLLMGGGFAMAEGAAKSGLSNWIGQQLKYLNILPPILIVVLIVVFAAFLTEVVSNMTTANIFLPVVRDLVSVGNIDFIIEVHQRRYVYTLRVLTFDHRKKNSSPICIWQNVLHNISYRLSVMEQ